MDEIFARLAEAGIRILPFAELTQHIVFERDGFIALVERNGLGFGQVGSAGLLAQEGFAALVQRGGRGWFVARGFEREATPAEAAALHRFSQDLRRAISGD